MVNNKLNRYIPAAYEQGRPSCFSATALVLQTHLTLLVMGSLILPDTLVWHKDERGTKDNP